jgi:hypothetical protein
MTKEAKDYVDSLRGKTVSPKDREETDRMYGEWFAAREAEERMRGTPAVADFAERREAVERHESNLGAEFQAKFSDLYKKALDHPDTAASTATTGKGKGKDAFNDRSAQMVEHLDRGLTRLREGKPSPAASVKGKAAEGYFDSAYADFVDVGRGDDGAADPAYQKGVYRGAAGDDENPKKGRSGSGGGLLNRVLRRS